MKNYASLIELTKKRVNPERISFTRKFNKELSTISYSNVLTYVRIAMKSVEPEYTERTHEAGQKVKKHLDNGLSDVSFKYQGSVMTNTHIKGYSDIDLLVISEKFYSRNLTEVNRILNDINERQKFNALQVEKLLNETKINSYGGSLHDLRALRLDSEEILGEVYKVCDISKPKAIKITNKSLKRDVDIVIANWYDDVTSIINNKGDYRGVQIYNKEEHKKENPDYPFASIVKINAKGKETNGRFKKMIRFLKHVKADSGIDIDLSSFDINAICFDIDVDTYINLAYYKLVEILYHQLKSICTNQLHADRIVSVDGREPIFRSNPGKIENVRKVLKEVESIYLDLSKTTIHG